MMHKRNLVASVVLLIAAAIFTSCKDGNSSDQKVVFMDSFKIFEGFAMKKDYDKMLEDQLFAEQHQLDSLGLLVNATTESLELARKKKDYFVAKQLFDQKFTQLSQKYTQEVYARLNEYIKAFGKEKKYSIILGSNGEGNVMYVDKSNDITVDILKYVNQKYSRK